MVLEKRVSEKRVLEKRVLKKEGGVFKSKLIRGC